MTSLLSSAETFLTNTSLTALLLTVGIYLSVKLHFFQIGGLPYIIKHTVGSLFKKDSDKQKKGLSPFQAVSTALAGTMGVGNIAGVSTALVAGGPGAIFWMWVSAFFGMMTKYSEIFLAVKHRRKRASGEYYGGPMYYMQDGGGGYALACIFAALCAVCSLGIGNMTQINSVSTALNSTFAIPPIISGIAVASLAGLVIFGGVKRIASVNEALIPFISILYICCSGVYLYIHRAAIGDTLQVIVSEAFRVRSIAGGVAGFGIRTALITGLSRGVFTNEAGLGSAPIVHAASNCHSPSRQAVWGIFEVFLDTIVVCTMTALVVLIAGNGALWKSGLDGAPLTSAAFKETFGSFGSGFISVSIVFFAFSSILGWCFYGETAISYLWGKHRHTVVVYRLVYILCIVAGSIMELTAVWRLSDILNALMAIPNVVAIILLRKEIKTPRTRNSRQVD